MHRARDNFNALPAFAIKIFRLIIISVCASTMFTICHLVMMIMYHPKLREGICWLCILDEDSECWKCPLFFGPDPLCKLVMNLKFLVNIRVFLMHIVFNYELSFVKHIQFSHSRLIITLICGENLKEWVKVGWGG